MLGRIPTVDLSQPGAVDDLIALHRSLFGNTRMEDGDEGDDGDEGEDGDEPPAKKAAAKKATAKKTAAKKAAAKGDDGDGEEEDESEKAQRALTEERRKVSVSATAIAKLTGRSKTEVSRALRKGSAAVDALITEAAEDEGDDGDEPPAKKTAAKNTAKSEEQIRREADREAEDKATARLVRSEVKAIAAETFHNPKDALGNLELDDYDVDEDGDLVDPEKVRADLAAVLKKFPHYAKKKGPKADTSQGKRSDGSGQRPKNMRELSRMTVED